MCACVLLKKSTERWNLRRSRGTVNVWGRKEILGEIKAESFLEF